MTPSGRARRPPCKVEELRKSPIPVFSSRDLSVLRTMRGSDQETDCMFAGCVACVDAGRIGECWADAAGADSDRWDRGCPCPPSYSHRRAFVNLGGREEPLRRFGGARASGEKAPWGGGPVDHKMPFPTRGFLVGSSVRAPDACRRLPPPP